MAAKKAHEGYTFNYFIKTNQVFSQKEKKYIIIEDRTNFYYAAKAVSDFYTRKLREQEEARLREEQIWKEREEAKRQEKERRRMCRDRSQDLYSILGISIGCSFSEVRSAYMALVRKNHPDIFTDPVQKKAAEERMKRINSARDTLELALAF